MLHRQLLKVRSLGERGQNFRQLLLLAHHQQAETHAAIVRTALEIGPQLLLGDFRLDDPSAFVQSLLHQPRLCLRLPLQKLRTRTQAPPLGFLHEQRLLDDGFQQLLSPVLRPQFRRYLCDELAIIRHPNRRWPHLHQNGIFSGHGRAVLSAAA